MYKQLHTIQYSPLWAETNKEWLTECGLYRAWAAYRESTDDCGVGGGDGLARARAKVERIIGGTSIGGSRTPLRLRGWRTVARVQGGVEHGGSVPWCWHTTPRLATARTILSRENSRSFSRRDVAYRSRRATSRRSARASAACRLAIRKPNGRLPQLPASPASRRAGGLAPNYLEEERATRRVVDGVGRRPRHPCRPCAQKRS